MHSQYAQDSAPSVIFQLLSFTYRFLHPRCLNLNVFLFRHLNWCMCAGMWTTSLETNPFQCPVRCMAFYSYLTVLVVHIGMEAMHRAGHTRWTIDSSPVISHTAICKSTLSGANILSEGNKSMHTSRRTWWDNLHVHCTPQTCILCVCICMVRYLLTLRAEMVNWSHQAPILQRVCLKLSDCISWQTALWSETHTSATRIPKWSIRITTDENEN